MSREKKNIRQFHWMIMILIPVKYHLIKSIWAMSTPNVHSTPVVIMSAEGLKVALFVLSNPRKYSTIDWDHVPGHFRWRKNEVTNQCWLGGIPMTFHGFMVKSRLNPDFLPGLWMQQFLGWILGVTSVHCPAFSRNWTQLVCLYEAKNQCSWYWDRWSSSSTTCWVLCKT